MILFKAFAGFSSQFRIPFESLKLATAPFDIKFLAIFCEAAGALDLGMVFVEDNYRISGLSIYKNKLTSGVNAVACAKLKCRVPANSRLQKPLS